ncbi:hypothetical protein D3C85_1312120 [compost metagenome]
MPTPNAITGSVATLMPIPSMTMSASQSNDVRASGSTVQITARQDRKVTYERTITAA